jgi:L-asparaginase
MNTSAQSTNSAAASGDKPETPRVRDIRARVFVYYTGGTIGMGPEEENKPGSPLVPQPLEKIMEYTPGLFGDDFPIELKYDKFDKPLDSSDVSASHWADMARAIEKVYDQFDGFVILHGTDTLAYTASALSFMFENLAKPVVLTGSQLPISHPRTDARQNFVNAVQIAGWKATEIPCIPEVIVVFADKILRGCRTTKVSSTAWAGFDSPNYPALGRIGEHIKVNTELVRPHPKSGQTFQVNYDLAGDVIDVSLFPGLTAGQLQGVLGLKSVKGVVLRTFGAGNAPNNDAFLAAIAQSINQEGKTIVNVTQCQEGMVEMGLYANSSALLECGVISGLDMTPGAALTKLMWTLGTKIGEQITGQMQVSQRGEQSENLFDLRYGACELREKFVGYRTPDRRFEVESLTRAVIRFSGLEVEGAAEKESVEIRVFMNKPTANAESGYSGDDPRCVAKMPIVWTGNKVNEARVIDLAKVRSVIGDGDITLSVIVPTGKQIRFSGLYLALFTRAA